MLLLDLISRYREALLGGLVVTLRMVALIWSAGIFLGVPLAILGARYPQSIGLMTRIGTFLVGAVPLIALLFALHYPFQAALAVTVDPEITCVVVLGTFNVLQIAEIVRPALLAFPKELEQVSLVHGLTRGRCFVRVKLPLLARNVVPSLLITQTAMLQSTVFGSFIGVPELFRVSQRVTSIEQVPVIAYGSVAVFFLVICLPLTAIAAVLQQKYGRDLSER